MVNGGSDNWERIWGNPRYGDWDLDDMEAFSPADDWEDFAEDMSEAFNEMQDSGTRSVPFRLLKNINDRLRQQGIEPKAWWAELYGR